MNTPSFPSRARRLAMAITCSGLLFAGPGPVLAADPVGTTEIPTATKDVLVVKDSKEKQTIDAAGRDITVEGDRNQLTITGQCHALTVNGELNFVSVEAVSSISLIGGGNQVAWGKAVNGEKPQITDQGKGNTVAKKKAE